MTDQKGFDLIAVGDRSSCRRWTPRGCCSGAVSGATRTCGARWRRRIPDRVSATIGFDERLAHLIEAGADMFLMPSRFEPCGLNQMYSLRYGTVPIVRATGGLADTVADADAAPESGTGFKFVDYTPGALVSRLQRALATFSDKGRWQAMQQRGMKQDHSWDASARAYVKLYAGHRRKRFWRRHCPAAFRNRGKAVESSRIGFICSEA